MLLNDKRYLQEIKDIFSASNSKYDGCDTQMLGEMTKVAISKFTVKYSKEKSAKCKEKYQLAIQRLERVKEVVSHNLTLFNIEALQIYELTVKEMIAEKTKAIIFRSNACWHDIGEKSS